MLFLCRHTWPSDSDPIWPEPSILPEGIRRRYRVCGRPEALTVCAADDGDAIDRHLRAALPAGGRMVRLSPLQEGFCRALVDTPLVFMLTLGWEMQARVLDGLWPEVVEVLQGLQAPTVAAVYRLAGLQEAVAFIGGGTCEDINRITALRLLHGVAIERVTVLRAL